MEKIKDLVDLMRDLWDFVKARKTYWLAPVMFVLLLLGVLFVTLNGTVVAPFIYAIF